MAATAFFSRNGSHGNRFARLALEKLETRECPAWLTLDATILAPHQVLLSGSVVDGPGAGIQVQFSGAANGSATTGADGSFSVEIDQANLGTVLATATEADGSQLMGMTGIIVDPPQISLDGAVNSDGIIWTISGHVTGDANPQGLVVQFGSLADVDGITTTVDANGDFSMTCCISEADAVSAYISASTVDAWGQDSGDAMIMLM